MNWFKNLFRHTPGPVDSTDRRESQAPSSRIENYASAVGGVITSPEEFANKAVRGAARWRTSIRGIPFAVKLLERNLLAAGVPRDAFYDLFNNSLLSVCPRCNEYCAGRALVMMDMLAASNVSFTGNSGGFERMIGGRCLNYSCDSTEHDLFWCPDLNPEYLSDLGSRGIRIDPNIQRSRDHCWKPAPKQ